MTEPSRSIVRTEPGSVFLSYARRDAVIARRLAEDLRREGIQLWIDELDIPVGVRWDSAVQNALRDAAAVVVILSPASVESENVLDEIAYALDEHKRVIPVLGADCEIPLRLRRLLHVDLRGNYPEALARVLASLGGLSGRSCSDGPQ